MRWSNRFVLVCLAWLLSAPLPVVAQTNPARAPWPTQQWAVAPPETLGMDSQALAELVSFGQANDMDSLVVTRHGHIVAEAYYAPFRPGMRHRQNSATKAVVAALTGIAAWQGRIQSTDQPVLSFFPERTVANLDDRKRAVTLQHVLDMNSGLDWTEPLAEGLPTSVIAMTRSRDWVQYVLDQPMARVPGTGFSYSSGTSHLLGAIVARQVGMPLQDYAAQQLFGPLGITDVVWQKDPQGLNIGGWGLYLQTRDMAKLGYLYLNRGAWDGRQIVPKPWVDKVYRARLPMQVSANNDWRYADQWWVLHERDAYMAVGLFRQVILVMPKTGVVAAMTGRKHWAFNQLLDKVAATVKSGSPLPANPAGAALLAQRVADVAGEPATPLSESALAQQVSGKRYRIEANPAGVTSFTLNLADKPSYEIVVNTRGGTDTRTLKGPLGLQGQFLPLDAAANAGLVAKARWIDASTLAVTLRWPEDAETASYTLQFTGKRVAIAATSLYGVPTRLAGETDD